MLVKYSSLAGGVFIEVGSGTEYLSHHRCFRFGPSDVKWATKADLEQNGPNARWFSCDIPQSSFIFA